MDFFDNAVSKAKEAIDIACKKTNQVVNTGKQKFDVASIENRLTKDFEALGRLYFEAVKNAEIKSEKEKALVDEINSKLAKIAELKDDINATKNMKKCPDCESYVASTALFCSNCGKSLSGDGENE